MSKTGPDTCAQDRTGKTGQDRTRHMHEHKTRDGTRQTLEGQDRVSNREENKTGDQQDRTRLGICMSKTEQERFNNMLKTGLDRKQ